MHCERNRLTEAWEKDVEGETEGGQGARQHRQGATDYRRHVHQVRRQCQLVYRLPGHTHISTENKEALGCVGVCRDGEKLVICKTNYWDGLHKTLGGDKEQNLTHGTGRNEPRTHH